MNIDPSAEYKTRLEARQQAVERYRKLDRVVAGTRLAIALIFLLALWLTFGLGFLSQWWLFAPLVVFIGLVAYHENVLARGRRALRSVAFYERGLARIEDRWIGTGDSQTSFAGESHLYAADLDIFGKGSLFELLSTARTRSGEETLGNWLCAPSSRGEILRRQQAIGELRQNIDLREDLAVLGADVRAAVHPELIKNWGARTPLLESRAARAAAPLLVVLAILSYFNYKFSDGSGWLAFATIAIEGAFGLYYRTRVRAVMAGMDQPGKDLKILSLVLARLERERFTSPELRDLRAELDTDGQQPSKQIARLVRFIDMLNYRLNLVFGLIAYPLLWATQYSFAIEHWRRRNGLAIARWLDAVGELEALCALAGYAYEHPNDPFPEILESGPHFEAEDLCHPLLPSSRCVANSLGLSTELQLMVVSGSNMSGKTTLLRTVGVNVVLALAGAPVRAKKLRLSPLAIGATLRVQDSLQGGTSHFYAEILRIRRIMSLTNGTRPVLFLFDEILHGTNSHDRAIGAEAIVRGLIDRKAIGLVTTHDLALARIANALVPRAANVHFQDELEDGRMVFDYRLRAGIVQKSNALDLMRAVGLEL